MQSHPEGLQLFLTLLDGARVEDDGKPLRVDDDTIGEALNDFTAKDSQHLHAFLLACAAVGKNASLKPARTSVEAARLLKRFAQLASSMST